jgi:uncharacterized membrane protein YkvA (DUF1232 family)
MADFGKSYTDESFWGKLMKFAISAGKDVIEKALTLYFCMQDADTPAWAKTIIVGALGYFIVPADAISDLLPLVGFTDDLGALAMALGIVAMHVKKEHLEKARQKLAVWFGNNGETRPALPGNAGSEQP